MTEEFNTTYEVCPHCGEEVALDAELKVQTCPKCGKRIVTCSMCLACDDRLYGNNYCNNCCLEYQAEQENLNMEKLAEFRKLMSDNGIELAEEK